MEINRTGVPELVDGRDLKCLATPEWFSSFLENAISLSASTCRNEARFGKPFWGSLLALTVDTLLAAMRTVARCTCTSGATLVNPARYWTGTKAKPPVYATCHQDFGQ